MLYFAEVAERGGFAAAGRALGIPKSRLSRRVAELEAQLGVRLLQRTTRTLSLTEVGEAYLRHMVLAAVESHPDIPVVLHQDHGATPAVCQQSIRSGFSSVMMDGSLREDAKTPASYDYNVEVTRKVCEFAHAVGVSVEGELGCLGSLESGEAGEEDGSGAAGTLSHDMLLTDPAQARDFVARTGVDALAIAIGTSHGAYKFTRKPTGDILAIDRIAQIHAAVPDEEGISSPAVAAAHEGYGVAWADRENGRVRFARLDARGALRGRVAIVHDGVDAPRSARIVWSGREFGVAVGLRRGVYFARVGDNGARLGEPVVLSEGESVSSIDAVEWDGRAFGVSLTVTGAQRVEQIRHRVARTDRHA
jgi:fructose/tagatose bisphosphate aldolase